MATGVGTLFPLYLGFLDPEVSSLEDSSCESSGETSGGSHVGQASGGCPDRAAGGRSVRRKLTARATPPAPVGQGGVALANDLVGIDGRLVRVFRGQRREGRRHL